MGKKGFRSSAAFALVFVSGMGVGNAGNSNAGSGVQGLGLPDPSTLDGPCVAEARAYADAAIQLANAEAAVQAAYDAYYECEMEHGGGAPPEPNPIPEEYSILER